MSVGLRHGYGVLFVTALALTLLSLFTARLTGRFLFFPIAEIVAKCCQGLVVNLVVTATVSTYKLGVAGLGTACGEGHTCINRGVLGLFLICTSGACDEVVAVHSVVVPVVVCNGCDGGRVGCSTSGAGVGHNTRFDTSGIFCDFAGVIGVCRFGDYSTCGNYRCAVITYGIAGITLNRTGCRLGILQRGVGVRARNIIGDVVFFFILLVLSSAARGQKGEHHCKNKDQRDNGVKTISLHNFSRFLIFSF